MELTIIVIKADIGGYVGHSSSHPDVIQKAKEKLEHAQGKGLLIDYQVIICGDDLQLIMTHQQGEDSEKIHKLAWDTFVEYTNVAKRLKLHGAGQDLLSDAFSGTVKGMGPGTAEMQFSEGQAETIVIFMADKTASGAWNLPLYKIFADPFNTIGLVIAPNMHSGFTFEVHDVKEHKKINFNAPEEIYDMLIFLGAPGRYAVKAVYHKESGEIAAVSSTQRLSLMAGRYIGKDDPVCIIRSQGKFPAVGEILEPLASPHIVEGWMIGLHNSQSMSMAVRERNPIHFGGPPGVIAAGFQLSSGKLVGPLDMSDAPAFDNARQEARDIADILRRRGLFELYQLPLKEMEYANKPYICQDSKAKRGKSPSHESLAKVFHGFDESGRNHRGSKSKARECAIRKSMDFGSDWDKRVFVGGSNGLSPIMELIREKVEKLGYEPILAIDFQKPEGMTIYHKCLTLLHSCKYAVFDLSEQAGQLLELERTHEYGVKTLVLWPKNKMNSVSQMVRSVLRSRGIKYQSYESYDELDDLLREFLQGDTTY